MQPDPAPLDPHENLYLASRKRFVSVYVPRRDGARDLVLYCGMQQITFDEPELFPWAEKLIQQDCFMAGASTGWADPALDWSRARELLEALIGEGVVTRKPPEGAIGQLPASELQREFLQREEEREATEVPRFWNPDPGAVLRDLTGTGAEAGWIESIIPVHRIAHIALDREGRQVGELNTWPDRLRLKVATERRTCNYAGSRYHDELPMNMTALRSMLSHWKPVLRTTLLFREEFLRRYPRLPDGRWRLGDLHFASSGVLALVAFQLMRWRDPVPNGELDPVLSSLFRVIDGVRMVAAHMMDVHELGMTHDSPFSPRDVTDAAEREDQYLSRKGVCAGPQNMIEELLETLMNGKPVDDGPAGPWVADIPAALDYGLLGAQLYAANFAVWMRMGLAFTRIREVLERAPSAGRLGRLREAVDRDWKAVATVRLDNAEQRDWSTRFAERMFREAQRGERGLEERKELLAELQPPEGLLDAEAAAALRDLFASVEEPAHAAANSGPLREIAGHLLEFLRFERHALRTVTAVQRRINALLGRPQPSLAVSGHQLGIHHRLRKGTVGEVPYLVDPIAEALGVSIDNRAGSTTVTRQGRSLTL